MPPNPDPPINPAVAEVTPVGIVATTEAAVVKAKERILRGELDIQWNDGFLFPIAIDVYDRVNPWVAQCAISYAMPDWSIEIPKGFRCDGASVPRALWLVLGFSPTDPALLAAFPHDFSYRNGRRRALADVVLYVGLLDLNPYNTNPGKWLWRLRSWFIYAGVRCFGWLAWRNDRIEREAKGRT